MSLQIQVTHMYFESIEDSLTGPIETNEVETMLCYVGLKGYSQMAKYKLAEE